LILESAALDVKPGQEAAFEMAFGEAKHIIASLPGFVSLELHRCIEACHRYLLLVRWEHLEDHTVGFRGSARYQQWRTLLHHFYDPFPVVEPHECALRLSEACVGTTQHSGVPFNLRGPTR
jgi:heme-degrading monooxygenase HmoA